MGITQRYANGYCMPSRRNFFSVYLERTKEIHGF